MAVVTSLKNFGIRAFNTRRLIFKAVFSNNRQLVTMSELLDKIVDVDIDRYGKFKYILVGVYDERVKVSKFIVRGYARAQWHWLRKGGSRSDCWSTEKEVPRLHDHLVRRWILDRRRICSARRTTRERER
ncbi:uncharacterized protein LOC100744904 isoform X2 [Bombus impatiens]|uniref:Uncharacterized protein LOC100744904 isoform X2 n=2 Tax=Pyrobombus TaxID=144703 RepID=A0A6P6FER2_BOMIM|nr:uncharacterized protein LOC100744904 isoform X2 [Bombus impatiens]